MHTRNTIATVSLLTLLACVEKGTIVEPSVESNTAVVESASSTPKVSQEAANDVARAIARALSSSELRLQVLENMRASPYAGHSLDLGSYLDRTPELHDALAPDLKNDRGGLKTLANASTTWLLKIPAKHDRATWRGTDNVVVVGSATPALADGAVIPTVEDAAPTGYRLDGSTVGVDRFESSDDVIMMVYPSVLDRSQEMQFRSRSHNSIAARQGTISSIREEYAVYNDCEPTGLPGDTCDPTRPGGTGDPPRRVLEGGWTLAECENTYTWGDSDADGLNDECERRVARAFAPTLMVDPDDDLTRDEYWVVMPGVDGAIMVFYAFGYHRDLGLYSHQLWGHRGDSEFLVFDLAPPRNRSEGDKWVLTYAFLSAHYRERRCFLICVDFDSSSLVHGGRIEQDSDGRPVIWVAYKKHANYYSENACDNGAHFFDTCDNNTDSRYFGVVANGNLGQYFYPAYASCSVPSRHLGLRDRSECMWTWNTTRARFYGWQAREGGGARAYGNLLADFGFWNDTAPNLRG